MRFPIRAQLILTFIFVIGLVVVAGIIYFQKNYTKRWELNYENQFRLLKEWISFDLSNTINSLNDKMNSITKSDDFRRSVMEYLISIERNDLYKGRLLSEFIKNILPVSGLDFIAFYDEYDKLLYSSGNVSGLQRKSRTGRNVTKYIANNKSEDLFIVLTAPVSIGDRFAGFLSGGINLQGSLTLLERNWGVKCQIITEEGLIKPNISIIETEIQGLRIGVEKDYGELEKELGIIKSTLIKTGAFAFLITLPLIYYFSGRLSRRIKQLSEVAFEIGKGNRNVNIRVKGRDEISRLAYAMRKMMDDIVHFEETLKNSERMAAWRDVARGIAHEIKNLLSPIEIEIGKLKKILNKEYNIDNKEEIIEKSLKIVEESSYDISKMIESFSEFAKMPSPTFAKNDIVNIVEETLSMFDDNNIKIIKEYPDDRLLIDCDKSQIKRSVYNVIKNSIESFDKDEKIMIIKVQRDADWVYLYIEDNGQGMDEDTLNNIFLPYFTKKKTGTGLGLAIVDKIIRSHNGRIELSSIIAKGTKFKILLPLEQNL
ncbi:MAG: ATP-binding protein [Candidatus Hydrogenedentota bacterium]